jgi:hypothetical protein
MKTEDRKFLNMFIVIFVVSLLVIGAFVAMLWK